MDPQICRKGPAEGDAMIELKRNCSSSVRDTGDSVVFGDFTIRISCDYYIRLMEIKNEIDGKLEQALIEVILRGMKA